MNDPINPDHYKASTIEAIQVIEEFHLNYHLGNVVKYILRCDKKGDPMENLQKAKWYLEREIWNRRMIDKIYIMSNSNMPFVP